MTPGIHLGRWLLIVSLAAVAWSPAVSLAQGTLEDYQRAERYLPRNIGDLVHQLHVRPQWIHDTASFWFRQDARDAVRFVRVDPASDRVSDAFDHEALARALAQASGESVDAGQLPFRSISFGDSEEDENTAGVRFDAFGRSWRFDPNTQSCDSLPDDSKPAGSSPDGRWQLFVRDWNLWLRDLQTDEERALTTDGTRHHAYAQRLPNAYHMVQQGSDDITQDADVQWFEDSRTVLTYRIDARESDTLTLVQAVPPDGGVRPRSFTYAYPMPGEDNVPMAEILVVDVVDGTVQTSDLPPQPILYYGSPWSWVEDHQGIYIWDFERGHASVRLCTIDPKTARMRVILEDRSPTSVIDPHPLDIQFLEDGSQFVWLSERDGWNHAYLYDTASGDLVNRITTGDWFLRYVVSIDTDKRQMYFVGAGREADRDPYLRHLYRVDLDGSNLVLLTPEPADHDVYVSPDHQWFVDTWSLAHTVPTTALRRTSDGGIVRILQEGDIQDLLDSGWQAPEPFTAKARDGSTDIYGVLWKPSNFDPQKRYPVLNKIYTGPHNFFVPKSFGRATRDVAQAMAEVGFIVVAVDGMGTGKRSKAFHDMSYKNLGRGGHEDHITAIQQIAGSRPWMDLERVGVYGFSAGGYDAFRALCLYPEFYKAAVAASGNHDHRMDKAWWNELWMGYPVGDHYAEQSNLKLAEQLEGELFLVHGELDENVHPYNTLRLADALIEANKDFEFLIMPNKHHYLWNDDYFIRKQWDFFVRHLWNQTPPRGYRVGDATAQEETD